MPGYMQGTACCRPGLLVDSMRAARGQAAAAEERRRLEAAAQRAAAQRNQQLAQLDSLQRQILADRRGAFLGSDAAWQERLQQQAAEDAAAQAVKVRG